MQRQQRQWFWRRRAAASARSRQNVTVAFNDLQDMQNHMRESIDTGLSDLQKKQGQGGLPKAPPFGAGTPTQAAFAADAPGPDTTAGDQIAQQTQAADQDEQAATATATGPAVGGGVAAPAPAAPAGPPPTISIGQTIDQVTASMGQPTRIVDLGVKKIYVYKDMKVTFKAGKVSDVE